MAQKREKEETELKVPETIPLRTTTITGNDDPTRASDPKLPNFNGSRSRSDLVSQPQPEKKVASEDNNRRSMKRPREEASRCSGIGCRRKVGIIGFRCRCGEVFCYEHRYSDRHSCSYDYKAAGREAIARENPVVRAAKLVKHAAVSPPVDNTKNVPAGIQSSTNNYLRADGQNCGSFLTERRSTKVQAAPGGGSSLGYLFGGGRWQQMMPFNINIWFQQFVASYGRTRNGFHLLQIIYYNSPSNL